MKSVIKTKKDLRKWVKEEQKKIDFESLSIELVKKLKSTNEYKQAKNIMIFYPLKNEVNLLKLLEDSTKKFYLPKINNENLLCCPYQAGDKLCESCFKTKEPITSSVDKKLIDLIIVPALAVDKKGYRLGYGGGFYDRFLANANITKLVCIPKSFILETIYPEPHDIQISFVITE